MVLASLLFSFFFFSCGFHIHFSLCASHKGPHCSWENLKFGGNWKQVWIQLPGLRVVGLVGSNCMVVLFSSHPPALGKSLRLFISKKLLSRDHTSFSLIVLSENTHSSTGLTLLLWSSPSRQTVCILCFSDATTHDLQGLCQMTSSCKMTPYIVRPTCPFLCL